MFREITIGQYYPADSVIHRLDPRVKLFGTIVFIIAMFSAKNVTAYIWATLFLAVMIVISKVPLKFILKGLKAIMFILAFTMIINIFFTPGTAIFQFKFIRITKEGILMAVKMGIRLVYLIIGSSLMTLTTTPNHLTDGLEKALRSLNKIRIPVHEIAMMMSIALRFIPILMEELDKIMKAQQARCADFESGNIFKKAKSLVPVLVPLFISSFRRANDLALAMEARCYRGGEGRTKMKPLHYRRRDYAAYLLLAGFVAGLILLNIFGMRILGGITGV